MYDSIAVADRFLTLARERGNTLTPMQLLKLVYIAHGWMLGLYGLPLIRDQVQAWQYGPVIPRLYDKIKTYRSQPVDKPLRANSLEGLDSVALDMVEQVYGIYGSRSGPALSRLTHADGTPWDLTYIPGSFGIEISNDLIEDHYQRLAASKGS